MPFPFELSFEEVQADLDNCVEAVFGRQPQEAPRFEVVASIAGRGFKVRREDMKKLLLATRGQVFTLENLDRLVDYTQLAAFKSR